MPNKNFTQLKEENKTLVYSASKDSLKIQNGSSGE